MATGDHDWAVSEVVSAANMDDYVQLQVVQQFATAAARDAALSARKREGMVTHQADTNTLTVYSGAAWSTIGPVQGALTTWTPSVGQGVGVAATVTYAVYSRVGRTVWFAFTVTCTGTGTGGSAVTVSLPVTAASSNQHVVLGSGYIWDNSTNLLHGGHPVFASTTALKFAVTSPSTGVTYNFLGIAGFVPALTTSDIISVTGSYEAAGDA